MVFGQRVQGLGTIWKAVLFQIVVHHRSRNFGKTGRGYSSATRLVIFAKKTTRLVIFANDQFSGPFVESYFFLSALEMWGTYPQTLNP